MKLKNKIAIILSGAFALAGIGSIAYAAIPDGSGVIHACYKTPVPAHGTPLNIIDNEAGGSCGGGQAEVTWRQGPPVLAMQVVVQPLDDVDPGQISASRADCPAGWQATGGGYSQDNRGADALVIQMSVPVGNPEAAIGWHVVVWNPTDSPLPGGEVKVICEQLQ